MAIIEIIAPTEIVKLGRNFWSARVSGSYQALVLKQGDDYCWFWIGIHDYYEALLKINYLLRKIKGDPSALMTNMKAAILNTVITA